MQTAQRDFEQPASLGRAFHRRRRHAGHSARLRLVLAVGGLAALVGWGVLNHAQTDPSADARSTTSTQEARLDGHGKWTGYTSP